MGVNQFDTSSSYSLRISSNDWNGGTLGSPINRHINSIVFEKDYVELFKLPTSFYVPTTYCFCSPNELSGLDDWEIDSVEENIPTGIDLGNLTLLSVDSSASGIKISGTNGVYGMSVVPAANILDHYISSTAYNKLTAVEKSQYREVPRLTKITDWSYVYNEGGTGNVGLSNGVYKIIESLDSQRFQCSYSVGGSIFKSIRYVYWCFISWN